MSQLKEFVSKPKSVKAIPFMVPTVPTKDVDPQTGEVVIGVRLVAARDVIHPPIYFGAEPWQLRIKADYAGVHLMLPPGEGGQRINPGDYLIVDERGKRSAMDAATFNAQFAPSEEIDSAMRETAENFKQTCEKWRGIENDNHNLKLEIEQLKAERLAALESKTHDHQPSENVERGSDSQVDETTTQAPSSAPRIAEGVGPSVTSNSRGPQARETRSRSRR